MARKHTESSAAAVMSFFNMPAIGSPVTTSVKTVDRAFQVETLRKLSRSRTDKPRAFADEKRRVHAVVNPNGDVLVERTRTYFDMQAGDRTARDIFLYTRDGAKEQITAAFSTFSVGEPWRRAYPTEHSYDPSGRESFDPEKTFAMEIVSRRFSRQRVLSYRAQPETYARQEGRRNIVRVDPVQKGVPPFPNGFPFFR